MPWQSFLVFRSDFAQLSKAYQIKIHVTQNARVQLVVADSVSYASSRNNLPIDISILERRLISVGFIRHLTEEQKRNISKLVSLPAGATFSVPGAGKTTEALAYYFYHANQGDNLLVVAPKNAFAAWDEQLKECIGTQDTFKRLRGGESSIANALKEHPKYSIITYQQFPRVAQLIGDYLSDNSVFMFLDESHRIKGGAGKVIADSILQTSFLPRRKLILSGTPMPQADNDLDPQVLFLYPDVNLRNNTSVDLIKPIYVRTTKAELGLDPPKRVIIPVHLTNPQQEFYQLLCSEAARQFAGIPRITRGNLRRLGKSMIKLMQFVSNPALLARDIEFSLSGELWELLNNGGSIKVDYACKRARELAKYGKKTLIWSSFVENVELISMRLSDIGADYIHGGVDAGDEDNLDTREGKIKRFRFDENAMVLVANPAAASEGISLHDVCHTAIYVDRTFNAAQYLQSEDRIHRYGLKKGVDTNIEILECQNTIDELIRSRLELKVDRMSQVLDDPSLNIFADMYAYEEDDSFGIDETDAQLIINYLRGEHHG